MSDKLADFVASWFWRRPPTAHAALRDTARALSKRPLPPLTTTFTAEA